MTSYDKRDNPDFIADFTLFILWSEIEANVAMIVCCLPTLAPVLEECRGWLVSILNKILPGRWMLLSVDQTRKTPDQDLELSDSTRNSFTKKSRGKGLPWQGDRGEVTAAGYSNKYEPSNYESGITAHTEITRTSEPRWRES